MTRSFFKRAEAVRASTAELFSLRATKTPGRQNARDPAEQAAQKERGDAGLAT